MTRIQGRQQRQFSHQHRQFSRHAVAAAVALVAAWAWPAQAQFYTYTGANNSYPINLFPIDTSQAALNLGSNQLWVGSGAVGSFAALAGAQFSVGGLVAGGGATGSGSLVFDGAQVLVGGQGGRLDIGGWGVGSLLVKGGSLLDATVNSAACGLPGQGCSNYIGNAAGSTASLTVTGFGSELRTLGFFGVGNASVFTQPASAFNFGTPGGSTNASLNVLAGGTLRTQNATISMGPGGANPTGSEQTFANVLIDGAGSRWVVTPDQFNGNGAYFSTSTHANAQSTLTISNGGKLVVDASSVSNGNASIDLGSGGTSTMNLSGVGSAIEMLGANRYINIGSRSGGSATLNLLGGATLDTRAIGLGMAGASGVLNVSGAGSWASLSGEFQNNGANLVAGSDVGGDGTITVTNGGRISISSSASTLVNGNLSMRIGAATGATGSLTISGSGSRVELSSTSTNGAFGSQDSVNPYVAIGEGGGVGHLTINGGGKLIVTGGARADWGTNIRIAGYGVGSLGLAEVIGAGSEIALTGPHAGLSVGGAGAFGQLDVLSGGLVSTGNLVIANQGGTGLVHVSGSTLRIDGTDGRLLIGDSGNGTLTVDNGGLVDATLNPANCIGNWCGSIVANHAGSTGLLTISGAGSELRTLRNFFTGDVWVDQYGGVVGGTTHATINILAGGTLRTENATLGSGTGGPLANGSEKSFTSVLIDGPGSQWVVSRNTVDNGGAALMSIGGIANATANVTVSNSGLLRIDGTGGAGPNSGINIGSNGKGTLVVSGAGSKLETAGLGAFINVGANNSAGDGSFQLLAGGTASSLFLNVGRSGGKGAMLIDGAGSMLTLSGVNTDAGSPGVAAASIGRNGGVGSATVSNGGQWLITDGGQDSRSVNSSPGLSVGRDIGGQGTLTITGAGSQVDIVSTSLGLAVGTPDNFNPFVAIGRDNPGTASGTLLVSDGGKLILSGNAVSTPTNGRVTGLNIGGRRGTAGNGTATVTGAGSELIVQGFDAHLGVGYSVGSTGVLNVLNQAKVSSTSMTVGVDAIGTVNVDNGWIALTGHRTDSSNVGAGITVGRGANGVGTLNLANASSLKIDATVLSGGMAVGGDQFLSGGVGTVTLSGGSSILFGGPVAAGGISVGFNGSGTMSLAGASLVDVGNTRTFSMASQSSGIASLSVVGASRLLGNVINIGGNSDTAAGGVGTALVSGVGSELRASGASGFIGVGRSGIGTLTVSNQAKVAAIVLNVGRSAGGVGTLSVNNSMIALSGQQTAASLNVGAAFTVGNLGGSGTASIGNGSLVTITNLDTLGASLNVGGTPTRPLGTGTLNVSGGSQIKLVAAPGLALARIGHDGVGTANFSGGSLLDVGDGNVIIAGQPGSVGTLTLGSGSVLNAGYVGVGSLPGGIDGGTGRLLVNASTVDATTLEIGKNSLVGGHLGVINAHVINRGTFSPGNSPGHIIINGAFEIQDQGKVVLDVQDDGGGNYAVDKLVLTDATTFNFNNTQVVFNFIGNTDPTKFAATGGLDLDNFILVQDAQGHETGLSTKLASQGSSWEQAFTGGSFNATSIAYNVDLQLKLDTSGTFQVNVSAVPEPRTYALWLLGLAALGWRQRRASKGQRAAP